jgi:hypothetical protein
MSRDSCQPCREPDTPRALLPMALTLTVCEPFPWVFAEDAIRRYA